MAKIPFSIYGFKCFENQHLEINNLTVLTGANASGKSSVIQSLLLSRLTTEFQITSPNDRSIYSVGLNNEKYALQLGALDGVYNERCDGVLRFCVGDAVFETTLDDTHEGGTEVDFMIKGDGKNPLATDFVYLNAERMGPRLQSKRYIDYNGTCCGYDGKYAATVLYNNSNREIDPTRWKKDAEIGRLTYQLDCWTEYIFPGVTVRSVADGESFYKIVVRGRWLNNRNLSAPNMGFGISYALPILLDGLLVSRDGWFIVENPEAHLHAKAQSNMGYFLAQIAASGVRVVVETQSEHIVNGMRRALLDDVGLKADMATIYFFEPSAQGIKVTNIDISENADLSDFPVDFFDQARQDLNDMFQLLSNKANGKYPFDNSGA